MLNDVQIVLEDFDALLVEQSQIIQRLKAHLASELRSNVFKFRVGLQYESC